MSCMKEDQREGTFYKAADELTFVCGGPDGPGHPGHPLQQ
jgi:hypothetical protein